MSMPMRKLLTDAGRNLVPPAGDRHGPLPPLLLTLTVVTGLVDAVSFLRLGHVFVANMTGNVVFVAFALSGAQDLSVPASTVALAAFLTGALAGGRLGTRLAAHRGRLLAVATAGHAVLVATALVTAVVAGGTGPGATIDGGVRYTLIVLLGLGMGLQNAVARRIAVPDLNTTVLTLTLTGLAADSAGGTAPRPGRRVLFVLAMFLGAFTGAQLLLHTGIPVVLALALALLLLASVTVRRLSAADAPWIRPQT
jgi:uncharacterized membrane protein YoaK (UPF0700 family)